MNIIKPKTNIIEKPSMGGIFTFQHRRDGKIIDTWDERNIVTQQGLNHILDVTLNGSTAVDPWYIGLYSNTYTPLAGDVYTDIGTTFTEITTAYDETTREVYTPDGAAAAALMTNSLGRATFTFNTGATVAGAIFVSSNIKGDSAASNAVLLAASAHSPSRSMLALDELLVKYEFQGSST